ncbi:DUF3987 domain-containing protein [Ferrimonas marina]|uniref:DUF3987 domain-containing protein n=1 Tax=Ferrimonas marina TaxID=299255 RepID=A0A1M5X7Z9_9GAMM|nr:DUF3987 domain-containing protein [Ferrimonas marina]SHH95955.1 Protein of unknown function [Ferrimonas marina]
MQTKAVSQSPCRFLWAEHLSQTDGFGECCYNELLAHVEIPSNYTNKRSLPAFLPSLAKAKTKEAVLAADAQTAFVLDIDDGAVSAETLKQQLEKLGCNYAAYSTFSSTEEAPRWRVILPLAEPIPVGDWVQGQEYLANKYAADPCCARIQQLSFAPGMPPSGHYDSWSVSDLGDLDAKGQQWVQQVHQYQQHAFEQEQVRFEQTAAPIRSTDLTSDGLFEAIKAAYPLEAALTQNGFRRIGYKYLPPESESGVAGVMLFTDSQAGFCHNSSCPLHNGGDSFDVIDVLRHYQYGGCMKTLVNVERAKLLPTTSARTNKEAVKTAPKPEQTESASCSQSALSPVGANSSGLAEVFQASQIARFGVEVASSAQFPVLSSVMSTLGVFSGLSSAVYSALYPDGTRLNTGLYVVVEQPPSAAKSRVLNSATSPIQTAVQALNKSWRDNAEASGDDEPARCFRAFATNGTVEAIEQSVVSKNNGHFSLASAEQGLVDVLLGNTRGKDRHQDNDLVLKGFGGEHHWSLRVTRSGYEGKIHGAIILLAQPGSMEKVVEGSHGQGIAERFLFVSEPNLIGKRNYSHGQVAKRSVLQDRYEHGVEGLTLKLGQLPSNNLEDTIPLALTDESWLAIRDYQQQIEPLLADGECYSHGILRGAFGKADIQIIKVAVNLYVAESLMLGQQPKLEIPVTWVKQAIQIVDALLRDLPELLDEKGIAGAKTECEAVMRMFKPGMAISERDVIKSRIRVLPFKEMTGNRSKVIRQALARCVAAGDLVRTADANGKPVYYMPR